MNAGEVRRFDDQEWTVWVHTAGDLIIVQPKKGVGVMGNWALNPYHRRGVGNVLAQLWRVATGAYVRSEYPKTERALQRSIRECEAFCRGENEAERRARALAARYTRYARDGGTIADG